MKEQDHHLAEKDYKFLQQSEKEKYTKFAASHFNQESRLPFQYEIGNRYHINTSSGQEVVIDAAFRHLGKFGESVHDVFSLAAFTKSGELVGHNISGVLLHGETFIKLNGGVVVLDRGQGYATPIELVHLYQMQEIANTLGKKVIFESHNENLNTLQAARHQYEHATQAQKQEQTGKITQLEKEQERWKTIFSAHGKLGFTEYKKGNNTMIHHVTTPQNIDSEITFGRKEIWLERQEYVQDGRKLLRAEKKKEDRLRESPIFPTSIAAFVKKFEDASR